MISNGPTYRSYCSILSAVLCYNLSAFYFGYVISYFNVMEYSSIKNIFSISLENGLREGTLSCIPYFGAMFGSLAAGKLHDILSRKQCFYFANLISVVGLLLIFLKEFHCLMIGRILQGFCVGFFSTITPIMIKEHSPIELSGEMGGLFNISVAFGFFFSYFLKEIFTSSHVDPENYWIYIFGFPLIIVGLQQLLLMTVHDHETVKYLLIKGRVEEAKQLITTIYHEEHHENIYYQKLKDLQTHPSRQSEVKEYPKDDPIAIFVACSLHISLQLTGITIVVFYVNQLTKQIFPDSQNLIPTILMFEKFIGSLLSHCALRMLGRKTLYIYGMLIVSLSLFGMFIGFQNIVPDSHTSSIIVLVSLAIYMLSFISASNPVTWLYASQVVQPSIVGLCNLINWALGTLTIFLFPIIKDSSQNKNCPYVFLFFCLITLVQVLICLKWMTETKEKTELQIRDQFEKKKLCD